jgi:hypothetical protein
LFRYPERVVELDAEVADRALDLRVAEQELYGPQVSGAPIARPPPQKACQLSEA